MKVAEAQELIFQRLCQEYKRHGDSARLSMLSLADELNIPSDVFAKAMDSFVGPGGGLEIGLDEDHNFIKLGTHGIARCEES